MIEYMKDFLVGLIVVTLFGIGMWFVVKQDLGVALMIIMVVTVLAVGVWLMGAMIRRP